MNKRIDELRLDAGIARLDDNFRLIVINKQGEVIDPLIGLENFAKLIIEECCNIIYENEYLTPNQCAWKIESNFGV
jgi:hypothetical protein